MKRLPEKHARLLRDITEELRTCTIYEYNQIRLMWGYQELADDYFLIYVQYTKLILAAIFASMSAMGFDLSGTEIPVCNEAAISEHTMLEAIDFSNSLEEAFEHCLELLGWEVVCIDLSYELGGCEENDRKAAMQSALKKHFPCPRERKAVAPLIAMLDGLFPAYASICRISHKTLGKYMKEHPGSIWNETIVPLMEVTANCSTHTVVGNAYLSYCCFANSDDYETFISPINYNLSFIIQAILAYDAMQENISTAGNFAEE